MWPKVQVLLVLVGLIMFLGVHADTESSEITEESRYCIPKWRRCTWGGPKCCAGRSCDCNVTRTNCRCSPRLFGLG
uniref:Toxin 25 n=1 Tax=Cupiennius salei TaxID=6928 RepID=A0A4Y5UH90_CUPSA|nr:toxin 25 precursor [Cupiennius salei]